MDCSREKFSVLGLLIWYGVSGVNCLDCYACVSKVWVVHMHLFLNKVKLSRNTNRKNSKYVSNSLINSTRLFFTVPGWWQEVRRPCDALLHRASVELHRPHTHVFKRHLERGGLLPDRRGGQSHLSNDFAGGAAWRRKLGLSLRPRTSAYRWDLFGILNTWTLLWVKFG